MRVRVNGREYRVNTSFWALVSYRQEFGKSYLGELTDGLRAMIRLTWAALDEGDRPYYHEFERDALADDMLLPTLKAVTGRILSVKERERLTRGGEARDEMTLLASWLKAGLPFELLKEFNAQMVADMIDAVNRGSAAPAVEMGAPERKELYGISPERESVIEAYLRGKGGEANG